MTTPTEERAYVLTEIEKYEGIKVYLADQLDIVDMILQDYYEELDNLSEWKRQIERGV